MVQRIQDMNWIESEVNAITICLNKNNTNEIITEYFGNKKRRNKRAGRTQVQQTNENRNVYTNHKEFGTFEMKLLVENIEH